MRVLTYGLSGTTVGGISLYLLQMKQFMDDGIVFDYVVETDECIFKDEIENSGGEIYHIADKSALPLKNIRDNYELLKRLRDTHEVAYFNLESLTWIEPIRMALKFGYRVCVHAHMSDFVVDDAVHHAIHSLNKRRLSHINVTRMTCSDKARNFMFFPGNSVIMVHNAIDIDRFRFDRSIRSRVRTDLKIKDDEKVIGFVGRLRKQKNPLFLVDILHAITEECDCDVKMIILGEGELGERLRERIEEYSLSDKTIILGNKPNVNEYYQAMDVLVMPSFHEGLPFTAVEAQAAGLHCVVSDRITRETNITGNVSFLQINDACLWGKRISEILSTEYDRSQNSALMEQTPFNIKTEVWKLEQLLCRVL